MPGWGWGLLVWLVVAPLVIWGGLIASGKRPDEAGTLVASMPVFFPLMMAMDVITP